MILTLLSVDPANAPSNRPICLIVSNDAVNVVLLKAFFVMKTSRQFVTFSINSPGYVKEQKIISLNIVDHRKKVIAHIE